MLSPKRVIWRKVQKGKMRGRAMRGAHVFFGDFGLQATECGRITSRQIEAARVAMTRYIKRGGQVWVRVFPDKPITKKAAETRMGSGKGNVEEWAAVIRPGRIIYEIAGISKVEASEALRLASHKLPLHCKVVGRVAGLPTADKIATTPKKAPAVKPAAAAAPKEATANG